MNDNVFNSLNNLINVSQIGNLPSLSAIEKSLGRYDDILKPLHMLEKCIQD